MSTRALRGEKDLLARILATAPGAFLAFRLSPDGTESFPYATAAVEELYGVSPHLLKEDGTYIKERAHPDDVPRVFEAIMESAANLEPFEYEYRYLHPVRGEIWLRVHSLPEREPDGGTVWLGFVQDITDQRRAEEARVEALKLEAVTSLSRTVARDFDALLRAIDSGCSRAGAEAGDHPARRYLERIHEGVERAMQLVHQLQAFGTPSEQRRERVQLAALVREVVALQRATLPPAVELVAEVGPPSVSVSADAGQLHQVVLNLVTNAVRAAGESGTVRVGIESAGRACIVVRDDGIGMDELTRRRIFDPCFTTKHDGTHSGLGLAMVQRIVADHGGSVEVRSAPGEGSELRVYLPTVR